MAITYKTTILAFGNNTGIEVPHSILESLTNSKKPVLDIQVNQYKFNSSLGRMSGIFLIPFSKEHRLKSGLKAGDKVVVSLKILLKDRTIEIPNDLRVFLKKNRIDIAFEKLSYSHRKEWVRTFEVAKKQETKDKRLKKLVDSLLK